MIVLAVALFLGAAPVIAGELVDRPEHCVRDGVFPCAVGSSVRGELPLKKGKQVFRIGFEPGAKILLYSPREAAVIAGEVALLSDKPFRFRHGSVKIDLRALALVARADRELGVVVLEGEARIKKPSGEDEVLVSGLRQSVGALAATSGTVVTKVAEPYEFAGTVVRWLKLAGLDRAKVEERLKRFRELWKTSVEVAASGYAREMGRQLASKEKKVEETLSEEELLRRRNRHLRELFRRKALDSGVENPD